jgi:endonuclease III
MSKQTVEIRAVRTKCRELADKWGFQERGNPFEFLLNLALKAETAKKDSRERWNHIASLYQNVGEMEDELDEVRRLIEQIA